MLNHRTKESPSPKTERIPDPIEDIAYYKEDLFERETQKEEGLHLIIFRLSHEWYGVEISKVKEVLRSRKITYLPSSPDHIAGIMNLRGNILSITNLKTIFNIPHEEQTEKTRIIAIESGNLATGLLVDEVVDSIEVPLSKLEPALLTIPAERAKFIDGQCQVENKLITIINVEKVLGREVEHV